MKRQKHDEIEPHDQSEDISTCSLQLMFCNLQLELDVVASVTCYCNIARDASASCCLNPEILELCFNVQISVVGGVDQSGFLSSQSVVIFKAVGPTTNRKTVFENCEANTKGFLFFDSAAQKAVKKATDTWWPGKFSRRL